MKILERTDVGAKVAPIVVKYDKGIQTTALRGCAPPTPAPPWKLFNHLLTPAYSTPSSPNSLIHRLVRVGGYIYGAAVVTVDRDNDYDDHHYDHDYDREYVDYCRNYQEDDDDVGPPPPSLSPHPPPTDPSFGGFVGFVGVGLGLNFGARRRSPTPAAAVTVAVLAVVIVAAPRPLRPLPPPTPSMSIPVLIHCIDPTLIRL